LNDWYKLDNVAKIFPSISKDSNSSVFRVSAILTENINESNLQKALDYIYNSFPMLLVRIRKGFFWDYLDKNHEKLLVEKEKEYPCKHINKVINKGYFLKVLYFEKRLSVEIFHSLTDGFGATQFLNSLIYYYFVFQGEIIDDRTDNLIVDAITEDGFLKYYKPMKRKKIKEKNAYRIKGKYFKNFGTNVISRNYANKRNKENI